MGLTRDLAKVDNQTIRQALQAGAAIRAFSRDDSETRWVLYTDDTATGAPVAVVQADRLLRIIANLHPNLTVLPGEAMITKREISDDPTSTQDRRGLKLAARAARAAEAAQAAQAALDAHTAQ